MDYATVVEMGGRQRRKEEGKETEWPRCERVPRLGDGLRRTEFFDNADAEDAEGFRNSARLEHGDDGLWGKGSIRVDSYLR